MSGFRLPTGGAIDRGRPLAFTFDGAPYLGAAGDSIASALLANGVRIVGRSFKHHRPRGVWGAWTEDPNAIVDVTRGGLTTPNLRAAVESLENDLAVRSVNAWPSAADDRSAVIDSFARFMPSGFYYKTFVWPRWETFEPMVRAMAGLGRLDPRNRPPADNPHVNAHCDMLVVGAGAAGLAAANAAARAGRTVILVDDHADIGGQLAHRGGTIDGGDWRAFADGVRAAVVAAGGRVMTSTTAFGVYDGNLVCAWERRAQLPDALWRIWPKRIVAAAGAIERPLVVPDNDRPGVMSADAALVYLRRHAVLVGRRIAVATNNDSAYAAAEALAEAGAAVEIFDSRADVPATTLKVTPSVVVEAVEGRSGVTAVKAGGRTHAADVLLLSGGWTPTVHLFMQARGKLRWDERVAALVPAAAIEGLRVAGAANGAFTLDAALREGHAAGGGEGPAPNAPPGLYRVTPVWPAPDAPGRRWIDFQSDVTLKDVALAAREGYASVEHLKRYTTLGMATDQGKTSSVNGLAALAAVAGRGIEEIGTTTYRPPFTPVPMTVVGGRRRGQLMNPLKRLPLEADHRADGAQMREYGGWLRPAWYGPDDSDLAIQREAKRARETVALFDGSSLGKIEVIGPDADKLVDFHSYNRLSTLGVGKIRYGFMLSEAGTVFDDGVTLRLAPDRFLVSCSSGHADAVAMRLEVWRQDRFDPRRVVVHDATAHWATLTLSGPRARDLVAALDLGVALDDAALPHMAFATGRFAGAPLRVARVSFTGDRSYEMSVPASRARSLRERIVAALPAFGGGLMGSEALMILRAEKGYVVVGKDTDGATMPHDLGVLGPRAQRKDEYIGKRSLFLPAAEDPDRKQLVGLAVEPGEQPLPTGAHVVEDAGQGRRSLGYVTSSYRSPTLERPIALGLVAGGAARIGQTLAVYHLGAVRRARIVSPVAFDPEGGRLHGGRADA
ncbi:sarcosine oxidase subunit alpha [Roseiarcus fermentans]|uniref:Sarcosine oxidase subunit alpha n=1 Tax=Roseiarcus fermentans TaxID=1473586 RepID=A0A366FU09_9HYPH|nr:2Fe-2S iron-sulfur cluster-binding protein [Roseiarcus fermentans]RBP17530.1 sarcosine oxidase subunit alpha [Roseiarcus fermentans]